mgnify:FL=1
MLLKDKVGLVTGGGDGILVGRKEEEFPAVILALVPDQVVDLAEREFLGGIFESIGEDGYHDIAGALSLGHSLKGLIDLVDGEPDGIQQGSHRTGDVGGGVEIWHFGERESFRGNFILVIEKDQAEAGVARGFALFAEELIKASNGGFHHAMHGSGAVEDVGDFE